MIIHPALDYWAHGKHSGAYGRVEGKFKQLKNYDSYTLAGEMAQGLRVLAILLKELGPVPITHMVAHFGL